ncbi:MAG: hypothetical protein F4238_13825 [Gemmatimonadetes bacterium]|nr:hypothetical protein [Gammaproteobacteria bacterium]MYE94430.1 hypothetical protein [Gemmatimonadota bacterium]
MSLIKELREIRDRADRLIQAYRYSELASDDACLAVLTDGEWRSIGYVQTELQRGGCPLERRRVSAVLLGLEKDGRLEGKIARTGVQRGEKRYRLRPGLDSA